MYLSGEAFRMMGKDRKASSSPKRRRSHLQEEIDYATKFIPIWVKICVAVALGMGTMIGWKRIVVTVGEKIGKTHLTYGQGAAAELIAASVIGAADGSACRFQPPMFCPREWRARWRPTARGCNGVRSRTSRSLGC